MENRESLWTDTCNIESRPTLSLEHTETEAVVIGGGLAGILTCYMLKEKGIEAIVVEANRIGRGTTGYTTGKITSQHDLIYDRLITGPGMEKARQYAGANQRAIDTFRSLIKEKNIDCQLEDKPSYLYTVNKDKVESLKKEAQAASTLKIPSVFMEGSDCTESNGWGLPFAVEGAVKFLGQAQYHPLKFLEAMAGGLTIYENTRVTDVQPGGGSTGPGQFDKSIVITENGRITAKYVIFTCRYPFLILPGYYFARMYQDRTYIMALSGCPDVKGLYLGVDKPEWSYRNFNDLLLIVGGSHRSGDNEKGVSYQTLRAEAKKRYPQAKEVYAWSTQDCMPLDGVPYIGQYASDYPNWFVATGMQKWGMSSSMVAADIISSLVSKKSLEVAAEGTDVFEPSRFTVPVSAKEAWEDVKAISGGLLKEIFTMPDEKATSIQKGHGGIVDFDDQKLGVYRDDENNLHGISTKCSHMGCQVSWNADEKSWDCQCHGSRFDIEGNVLSGPALIPTGQVKSFG